MRRCKTMGTGWLAGLLTGLAGLGAPSGPVTAAEALPQLEVELDATSVSGLSAGAYMAGQIELAHSKDIVGAGIVAGGPFACAETASSRLFPYWPVVLWQNASQASNECMQVGWGAPDADALAQRAKELAQDGKIDPLSGLADDKVYLFSGNEDKTVLHPVVEAAKRFYEAAGVPSGNLRLLEEKGGHAFETEREGTACGLSETPLCQRLQLRPGESDPGMDLWPPRAALVESNRAVPGLRSVRFRQDPARRACPRGRRLRAFRLRKP